MAKGNQVGEWAKLFGGRRTFSEEIGRAVEIGARWDKYEEQRDVVFDELPGWLPPLWGADREWFYLRRPEGIWKARIPAGFDDGDGAWFSIYCNAPKKFGKNKALGGDLIGHSVLGHPGWIEGASVGRPIDAADMDEKALPSARGLDVRADAVASGWGRHAYGDGKRLVIESGDWFAKPPIFRIEGDWLMASDTGTGRTVAFPMVESQALAKALMDGKLWLRFESKWLPAFETKALLSR